MKLRVVFDASAKTTSGVSLNDTFMIGSTIQNDLFTILTKFGTHRYAFTADIHKMYRQILVDSNDCKYQTILWRDTPTQPIKAFKLKTITYGTGNN